MSNSVNYPIMLNLTGKSCVVVGGGKIATRKIKSLIEHQAHATVISPTITASLHEDVAQNKLIWARTPYTRGLLAAYQPVLVFAATNNSTVNQVVATDAQQIGAWVNGVDGSVEDDFSNMLTIGRAPLTIGISTGGTSPALAKYLRTKIEATIGHEYSLLAHWLGELREILQDNTTTQTERAQIYAQILESDVIDLLQEDKIAEAYSRIYAIVLAQEKACA